MGDQKIELSYSVMIAEPKRKKNDSALLVRTQPIESHGLSVYWFTVALPNSLFLQKYVFLP